MKEFSRSDFYPIKKNFYTKDLLTEFKELIIDNKIENNFLIKDISSLENQRNNSLLFISKPIDILLKTNPNIMIITDNEDFYTKINISNKLLVKNLDYFYITILNKIFYHEEISSSEDDHINNNHSYISKFSSIDNSSKIGINAYIGRGVKIGKNCLIKNNVVIKNTILGDNVIIGDNSVIGSTGFGFNLKMMGATNSLPHIGIVLISDNVRIGSCCTIDRAKIDITFIGKNTMIDNLCHIAHNVQIGNSVCIAAQSGISGSTVIGNNVIIGGQSGFAGHIKIGNNVIVAAKSGVTKNIKDNSRVAGFPAMDIKKWKKTIILNKK